MGQKGKELDRKGGGRCGWRGAGGGDPEEERGRRGTTQRGNSHEVT